MTKKALTVLAVATILFSTAILGQSLTTTQAFAQVQLKSQEITTSKAIPEWVDNNFRWYAEGAISQIELVNSLEFLVIENIIQLPSTVQDAQAQEITQSMEEMQQRLDRLEFQDEPEIKELMQTLEMQVRLLQSDPQTVEKITCPKETIPNAPPGVNMAIVLCHVINEIKGIVGDDEKTTQQIQMLGEQVKKAEVGDLETNPTPEGTPTTYVKYKKGTPENFKLTVLCNEGDVATGGGFMPALTIQEKNGPHGSMPFPAPYANSPLMPNPYGWTYYSADPGEARVWVVCLDLTPSSLSTGSSP